MQALDVRSHSGNGGITNQNDASPHSRGKGRGLPPSDRVHQLAARLGAI